MSAKDPKIFDRLLKKRAVSFVIGTHSVLVLLTSVWPLLALRDSASQQLIMESILWGLLISLIVFRFMDKKILKKTIQSQRNSIYVLFLIFFSGNILSFVVMSQIYLYLFILPLGPLYFSLLLGSGILMYFVSLYVLEDIIETLPLPKGVEDIIEQVEKITGYDTEM